MSKWKISFPEKRNLSENFLPFSSVAYFLSSRGEINVGGRKENVKKFNLIFKEKIQF